MSDGSSRGRNQLSLYLIVVAVYLFWGGTFVFSKIALKEIPGALAAGMRTIIAAAALMAVYKYSRDGSRPPLRRGLADQGAGSRQMVAGARSAAALHWPDDADARRAAFDRRRHGVA